MPDTDRMLSYTNPDLVAFKWKIKIETRLTKATENKGPLHES